MAATRASTVVVADLVAQPGPELDRQRLAGQVGPVVVEQERLHVQRLDAEGGVRSHVDGGAVPPPGARPRPRRCPDRAAGAGATCAGSPWGSRVPCRGRDPRRPRRPTRTGARAPGRASPGSPPTGPRGPRTRTPGCRGPTSSVTLCAVSPVGRAQPRGGAPWCRRPDTRTVGAHHHVSRVNPRPGRRARSPRRGSARTRR